MKSGVRSERKVIAGETTPTSSIHPSIADFDVSASAAKVASDLVSAIRQLGETRRTSTKARKNRIDALDDTWFISSSVWWKAEAVKSQDKVVQDDKKFYDWIIIA